MDLLRRDVLQEAQDEIEAAVAEDDDVIRLDVGFCSLLHLLEQRQAI